MKINKDLSTNGIYAELVRRFKEYRISAELTQGEIAEKAMLSKSTVSRFERGDDISMSAFIALLGAVDIQGNLEVLIPDPDERPSFYLPERKNKKRVRHKEENKGSKIVWKWGDEE